jgi:hypothetical protein
VSTLIATNGNITNVNTGTIKDSTGNTTAMTIDSGGRVLTSARPAFYAKVNSEQSNIATNQWVDISFTNIISNQGSHFGGTVFTAPATGYYHFSTYLRLDSVDTAATYYLLGWEIGGTILQADLIDPNFSSDLSYMGRNSSLTYYMTATQTAAPIIYQAGGTSQTDIETDSWFSGHFVG